MAAELNHNIQDHVVVNALIIAVGQYFDFTMKKKPFMYEMKHGFILFMVPAF